MGQAEEDVLQITGMLRRKQYAQRIDEEAEGPRELHLLLSLGPSVPCFFTSPA